MERVNSRAVVLLPHVEDGLSAGLGRRAVLRSLGAAMLGAASAATSGCGGRPAQSPFDALKTPDERTAIAWIARAFRKRGFEVESGRVVHVGDGLELIADIAAVDAPWGVAWLRTDEQHALAQKKMPPPPPEVAEGALWVHRGVGDDADERVLVLIDKHFQYDPDPRGEGVVHSIQEVESRAVRDVLDFLVRAQSGGLA